MGGMDDEDPWKWMQPYDVRRFGDVILDEKEQERWCRAVLLGGLAVHVAQGRGRAQRHL